MYYIYLGDCSLFDAKNKGYTSTLNHMNTQLTEEL
jgi:hypothetical protein